MDMVRMTTVVTTMVVTTTIRTPLAVLVEPVVVLPSAAVPHLPTSLATTPPLPITCTRDSLWALMHSR